MGLMLGWPLQSAYECQQSGSAGWAAAKNRANPARQRFHLSHVVGAINASSMSMRTPTLVITCMTDLRLLASN